MRFVTILDSRLAAFRRPDSYEYVVDFFESMSAMLMTTWPHHLSVDRLAFAARAVAGTSYRAVVKVSSFVIIEEVSHKKCATTTQDENHSAHKSSLPMFNLFPHKLMD